MADILSGGCPGGRSRSIVYSDLELMRKGIGQMSERKKAGRIAGIRAGGGALRRRIRPRPRLKIPRHSRLSRFFRTIVTQTPFVKLILLLTVLWLIFAVGIYFAERGVDGTAITSYGRALYWGIAAFSTAGIADTPVSGTSEVIGGIWIVVGSAVFFGTIVATITTYFTRPMQRPVKQIVDTIEYNLEQLEDLSPGELNLLRETTNTLIDHIKKRTQADDSAAKN